MRVLVAGATGALGMKLVPKLVAAGHRVIATTRNPDKGQSLFASGAELAEMDGLDATSVSETVTRNQPDAIIHQMTALAGEPDMRHFDRWFSATNELRTKGTDLLLGAARTAGVDTFIAQSYTGWNNQRTGGPVKTEEDPLDQSPTRQQSQTLAAIRKLEETVLSAPLKGIVLRYGNFYGPGASEGLVELVSKRQMPVIGGGAGVWSWIHVGDAASATVAALEKGSRGVYNVVDDEPATAAEWLPHLARAVGARPPIRMPAWLARILAGQTVVQWMTEGRGASNAKAKAGLGWELKWPSWRNGFEHALTEFDSDLS